jgi:hypothetical protein
VPLPLSKNQRRYAQGRLQASGPAPWGDGPASVAGFPLGTRKKDRMWGANVWVEAAGYAVDEPELIRDLYAFSSQRWTTDTHASSHRSHS